MDSTQALEIIDKIKGQWPQWRTSEIEEQFYCKSLRPFTYEVAYNAIDEHKLSKQGSGLSPKLYQIIEICKSKGVVKKKKRRVVINFYAECIKNDRQPWRVGERMPFYAESLEKAGKGELREKAAELTCEKLPGTWIYDLVKLNGEEET